MTPVDLPAALGARDRLYIEGTWVEPSTRSSIEVIDPSSEEPLYAVAEAQATDVERAIAAARQAFEEGPWSRMGHGERAEYLRAIAAALTARSGLVADVWSREMGIVNTIARSLTPGIAATYELYADLAEEFPFVERHPTTAGGACGFLVREPVGVVGAIIPWNGPMPLMALKVAPALLAGCTVVVKSSPEAPGAGYLFAAIAESVGLPPGVVNVVTADRAASEELVRNPGIDKVSFTGSTVAGRRIASILGERIGRYTLELGGKSAAVVLDDAVLADVAASVAGSATVMTGQACAALTRVVIPRSRHDELVDALCEAFSAVTVGDPFDPATRMGPLVTGRQRDRIESYIEQGCAEGARLAIGGRRPSSLDRGFYVEPTVFADVSNASTVARNEIFGPVVCVVPADDEAAADRIANDSIYGLNASVYTADHERAWHVARQLRAGTVGHNAPRSDFGIGFGGFKQSGVGREGGREGLLPYLESKTVILDAEPSMSTVAR